MTLTERIKRASEALFDLASAEIDRGVIAVRMAGVRLAFRIVGLVLATYGVLGVAGAIAILLAPRIGLTWSVLLVSLVVMGLGGLICAVATGIGRQGAAAAENQARIESAKAAISVALDPPPKPVDPARANDPLHSLKEQVEAAIADPRVLTGAAFAAMSIVGPFRLLKIATKSAGAASAIAAIAAAVKSGRERSQSH